MKTIDPELLKEYNRVKWEEAYEAVVLNKVVLISMPDGTQINGKVDRLAVEKLGGHPALILHINHKIHHVDVEWFMTNTVIN
jgi:hypothetical protein